ncbi:uncharacterized protein LOC125661261 isoform X3 [Ostrea edulis]|uniref:uncharacterized protein LOC125661261 isoform X3 n=1 Tax=Ostrea edulis TaxID=37623 RepID=UPI0024AF42E2|nr:uncharacterized protein LOC125661261 isoform X3 [Ostrea edulis]
MYLGRDHRPSESKLGNFLTYRHERISNPHRQRSLMVTQDSLVLIATEEVTVPKEIIDLSKTPACTTIESTVSTKENVILSDTPTTKEQRNTEEKVTFKRPKDKRVRANDRGRVYECLKCLNFRGKKGKAESHYFKMHVAAEDLPWYCGLCNFRCESEADLKHHPNNNKDHKRLVDEAKSKAPGTDWDDTQFFTKNPNAKTIEIDRDLKQWTKEDSIKFWEGRKTDQNQKPVDTPAPTSNDEKPEVCGDVSKAMTPPDAPADSPQPTRDVDEAGTPTTKELQSGGEKVPSIRPLNGLMNSISSPNESATSVSTSGESKTKAGTPTKKRQNNTEEKVPRKKPKVKNASGVEDSTSSSASSTLESQMSFSISSSLESQMEQESNTESINKPKTSSKKKPGGSKQSHLSFPNTSASGEKSNTEFINNSKTSPKKKPGGSKQSHLSSANTSASGQTSNTESINNPLTSPEKKKSASKYTKESLQELKVFYAEEPMDMKLFFDTVKSKADATVTGAKVEQIMNTFKRITEEQLGMFSIDLDDLFETKKQGDDKIKSKKTNVMHHIMNSTDEINDFSKIAVEKKKYKDSRIIRLLIHWTTAVTEFMQNCADVVQSILLPGMHPRLSPYDKSKEKTPREILYHTLFMSFSRMFLLCPRQQRKVERKLGKNIIGCESDVCFLQSLFSPGTDAPQLVMMCEVKRDPPSKQPRQEKTWIENKISSKVMGQIGMELLCESTGSYFSPKVAGIACLRSEIMFLFLDITKDHIQALEEDKSLERMNAKISYTETYDILKPEDRSKFMDILLYFAAIQSCNFNSLL